MSPPLGEERKKGEKKEVVFVVLSKYENHFNVYLFSLFNQYKIPNLFILIDASCYHAINERANYQNPPT